jgi:hypothetical protein
MMNFRCVIFALTLFFLPARSDAGTISFETRPDGTMPTDNEELAGSYTDGSTIVTFGFDTNSDLKIDVNARFEKRGTDPIFGYITDTDDDLDKTGTGQGGDWVLRRPKDTEPNALDISSGSAFLVKYSGMLPSSVSGEIWDIDSGEQYLIEAFDGSNFSLGNVLSFIGLGGCCGGPEDGLPFTFTFINLNVPIATVKITEILDNQTAGFAFDNFSTIDTATVTPEPSSIVLLLGCIILLGLRLSRS